MSTLEETAQSSFQLLYSSTTSSRLQQCHLDRSVLFREPKRTRSGETLRSTLATRFSETVLVLHADQNQSASRRGCPRGGAIARFEKPANVLGFQRALTDKNESAHKIAHHVMQEAVPPDVVYKFIPLAFPHRGKDSPHIRECS